MATSCPWLVEFKVNLRTFAISQINTLQQLENLASHEMAREKILTGAIKTIALWYDVTESRHSHIYYFDRTQKKFIVVDERNVDQTFEKYMSNKYG